MSDQTSPSEHTAQKHPEKLSNLSPISLVVKEHPNELAALREQNEENCDTQESGRPQTYEDTEPFGVGLLFRALTLLYIPDSD